MTFDLFETKKEKFKDGYYLKEWSGHERSLFAELSSSIDKTDPQRVVKTNAMVIALCLVDEAGEHVFTLDDIDKISSMPSSRMDEIVKLASKVNKLTVQEVEQQEKNSE